MFCEKSGQAEVYEFLVLPIVRGKIQKLCYIGIQTSILNLITQKNYGHSD